MSAPVLAVTAELGGYQGHPERGLAPAMVRLCWSRVDPFAVHLSFRRPDHPEVTWVVARDLLVDGVTGPAGLGDVRVYPDVAGHGDLGDVVIVLSNGRRRTWFRFDVVELIGFLNATLLRCPQGDELTGLNLDAEIAALLRSGGGGR